jgi:hypothetical protein
MASMKEISIRQYISNIDFKSNDWSINKIKEDMRRFLGEEPGIEIEYRKDVLINEIKGEAIETKSLDKVSIVYFDLDDRFKKIEFLIDEPK